MGRRPSAAQQRAQQTVRKAIAQRRLQRTAEQVRGRHLIEQAETKAIARQYAENYLRKTGKSFTAPLARYLDLSEGSEFVVLNNKPSTHANKQAPAITDKPVRVFNAQSQKFSYTLKAYKDLQGMFHFDFRDAEAMPTKHIALTQHEMLMLRNMIVADMNYTELLELMEQLENER